MQAVADGANRVDARSDSTDYITSGQTVATQQMSDLCSHQEKYITLRFCSSFSRLADH